MGLGAVFWWNVWTIVQVLVVVGLVVAVAWFIRWGKRKTAASAKPPIA